MGYSDIRSYLRRGEPMSKNLKVLVTGASGFVGSALVRRLAAAKLFDVIAIVRRPSSELAGMAECIQIAGMTRDTLWEQALAGVDVVVHAAARVHITTAATPALLAEINQVNVQATMHLAQQAAAASVRRFIFLSTIGVNGAETFQTPYTPDDICAPRSPYALSKYEAEQGLRALAHDIGMGMVIIRPPLVYGPGVKGNFLWLMRLIQRGMILPLGAVDNRRSMVALDNLVDMIVTCITHPAAVNQTFLVSDGEDISTTQLLRRLGKAMGKSARLVSVPVGLLRAAMTLIGKEDMVRRACGSMQADISKTQRLLGWAPRITLEEGLKKTVAGFRG